MKNLGFKGLQSEWFQFWFQFSFHPKMEPQVWFRFNSLKKTHNYVSVWVLGIKPNSR
jgi:hypothetical protein